ncbi:G-protein alpha subunit-domain-containing protein [Mycena leptocephala]|nr:G-protein alpha subunit-domain-containing protein [Mycena leptocephala]
MGGCVSSPAPPGGEVSERDRALHSQAEKALKEAKAKMAVQVKVLLGSGDSGKSTILKQMRLIHKVPFSAQETESFRQLVFDNLTRGLKYLLDALPDMGLALPDVYSNLDAEGCVSSAFHISLILHYFTFSLPPPSPLLWFLFVSSLFFIFIFRASHR